MESRAEIEFRNWVRSLDVNSLSEHERRLINVILNNFAELEPLGTAGARRANRLKELIDQNRLTASPTLNVPDVSPLGAAFPIRQIQSLQIGPFRGFSQSETFDLSKSFVLVYGPNGSGKSSLCEGIEYALLGTIQEAESKRIKVNRYAKNIAAGTFSDPILTGVDAQGQSCVVVADPQSFGFCFIEKNRIESFARMTATTPADQTARIASLFGLDQFNSFVEGFTDNFDNYLDLVGLKMQELQTKEAALQTHHAVLASMPQRVEALAEEKVQVVGQQKVVATFDELAAYVNGDSTKKGRIAEIETILMQAAPCTLALPSDGILDAASKKIEAALLQFLDLADELQAAKADLSFKKLYEAVIEVENHVTDSCPACLTPLSQTATNPFSHARKKRDELKKLVELESKSDQAWQVVQVSVREGIGVLSELNQTGRAAGVGRDVEVPPVLRNYAPARSEVTFEGIALLAEMLVPTSPEMLKNKLAVEKRNAESQKQVLERSRLEAEKMAMRAIADRIIEIRTKESAIVADQTQAQTAVREFQKQQSGLIKAAQAEKPLIEDNVRYVSAYNALLAKLRAHRDGLPTSMVRDISDLTRDIYNNINAHDCEFDRLATLELPTAPGANISVRFCGDATCTEQDALHVLSEGHLRCLGLAVLLAKNVHQGCPFVIFDDVVNAIDDEHRHGIAELLSTNSAFRDKQIIVTTHGEEFAKTLSTQFCQADYQQKVCAIDFISAKERREIVVNHACSVRNYVVRAEEHQASSQWRDCLMNCRRAVENSCHRLWNRLARKYNIGILVLVRSPRSDPDLSSVVDGLLKFLKNTVGETNEAAKMLCENFSVLKQPQAWTYLNQGTHDVSDLEEFDAVIVNRVLAATKTLDDLAKTAGSSL